MVVLSTVADLGTLHFAISHFVLELQYQQNMIILKQCFKIFVYIIIINIIKATVEEFCLFCGKQIYYSGHSVYVYLDKIIK